MLVAGYPLNFGENTEDVRGDVEVVIGLICVAGVIAMNEGEGCGLVVAVVVLVLLAENVTGGVSVCLVVVKVAGLIISEDLDTDGDILGGAEEPWDVDLDGLGSCSVLSCPERSEFDVSF